MASVVVLGERISRPPGPDLDPVATPRGSGKLAVGVLSLPDPASPDQPGAVSLTAHLDARASRDLQSNSGIPTLVHFTDSQAATSLEALAGILRLTSEKGSALSVFVVLAGGMLERMQYKELAELRSLAANSEIALAFTEDYEGTWVHTLHVVKLPSTHLLSRTGRLVWQQDGP